MNLGKIIRSFVAWRVLLILLSLIASLIPARQDYIYRGAAGIFDWFTRPWGSFDGNHYLNLATHWYGSFYTYQLYAFFPAYPWLIRNLTLFGNYLFTSQFINHIFILLSMLILYKLLRLDVSHRVAKLTIFLMAIFPTSFFFVSSYTESLFLLLSVLTFYCAITRRFFLAAVFAAFASLTRLAGIFLWPALVLEYISYYKANLEKMIKDIRITSLLVPPLGLLLYMDYQFTKTGDYLFFIHSQPGFGANRVIDKLVLLHQVFYRYFRMLFTVQNRLDPVFFVVILELICGLVFFFLILVGIKNLRRSYLVYVLLSFIVPTLTGTLSSVPRYVLVLFPCFLVAAQLLIDRPKSVKILVSSISIILLVITAMLFTRGYFVS